MITQRQLFLNHVGQTSPFPLGIEVEKAKGIYIYDIYGKKYTDLVSGVSVSNIGHRHKKIVKAVKKQLDKYMHLMVYGEYIQSPQVKFAELLTKNLPEKLNSVYFVNSGSEAIEGAMKLAKRYTGRSEIIACKNAYHGSTHGALSLMSSEYFTQAFRPLLPDIKFMDFNKKTELNKITKKTAAVIIEVIQAEAGIILGDYEYISKLRKKCYETGTLLIIDEVQTGFGRTGSLFAFEQYNIVPDIIALAKAMGGGMPTGAFISDKKIMSCLSKNPVAGHITTFGGHPISAAAAFANLKFILEKNIIKDVEKKGKLFLKNLKNKNIKSIRGKGLFYSVELENHKAVKKFIKEGLKTGLLTDWFLFSNNRFRIAPPLTITKKEILKTCKLINITLEMI